MSAPPMLDQFAAPYIKEAFADAGDAKKTLQICGDTTALLDHMIAAGVEGVSIEKKVQPESAVQIVARRVALVGNVGVVKPLLQGTPSDVAAATTCVKEAGFNVVAPGSDLLARVPVDNIKAMVRAVKG